MKKEIGKFFILIVPVVFMLSCSKKEINVHSISVLPQTQGFSKEYTFNRQPLQSSYMAKLPLGSIHAKGWLHHQLELMADGMTGHLTEISNFLKPNNGWLGGENDGWEEQAYWFRGFYSLSVLTGDPRLQGESQRWIEAIISSQDNDGYFGPKNRKCIVGNNGQKVCDLWPHMIMIEALISHYEATGDKRVPRLLERFFQFCQNLPDDQFIPLIDITSFGYWQPSIQSDRAGDMIPSIVWLYNQTGESWLLDLAWRFYRRIAQPSGTFLDNHVINFTQRFAYAGIFSQISKESWQMELTEYWYKEHMTAWGQTPGGIFAADERIRPGYVDPRQGFETCGFGEFARSFYLLARLTGKTVYADRTEDLLFNHFPAAMTPDLKGLHYLTASNQPQLDAGESHDYNNKGRQISYSPWIYRCCQHNVAMTWPRFVENLWQASADQGLIAWMYAPNNVTAKVGKNGTTVSIETDTNYPFKGRMKMRLLCSKPVTFPLYLRVPIWSVGATIRLNDEIVESDAKPGEYLRIEHTWVSGDRLEIDLPMTVSLKRWPRNGSVTVNRGPLSYSVKIGEKWSRYGGNDLWPEREVFPTTPWNYGLLLSGENPAQSFKVVETSEKIALQPWTEETAPIRILVKAKRIPNWQLDEHTKTVPDLQPGPILSNEKEEEITMIPLGCARLRISCLPVIGEKPYASEWQLHPIIPRN